jgi:hypothetical protein
MIGFILSRFIIPAGMESGFIIFLLCGIITMKDFVKMGQK